MKQLDVIVDMQFGSTGKGLLAGYLANRNLPDTLITAWAPNAGHTFIDNRGNKYVHCMIPNGVVSNNLKRILIGPGSVIDPALFESELNHLKSQGVIDDRVKIAIHEHAAVVTEEDRQWERANMVGIGSTMKGVGRAVARKLERPQVRSNVAYEALNATPLYKYVVSVAEYNDLLDSAEVAMVEGHQGYSLSINHGMYPYTTSRDCTTMQILSDCGFPFDEVAALLRSGSAYNAKMTVWGSARTYPIRVANRFQDGKQVGWSGPHYPDQVELQWEDIGREPELTTVTKLPRRIFTWSQRQMDEAMRINGIDFLFLNFVNYWPKEERRKKVNEVMARYPLRLIGMGPTENDVMTVSQFAGLE